MTVLIHPGQKINIFKNFTLTLDGAKEKHVYFYPRMNNERLCKRGTVAFICNIVYT